MISTIKKELNSLKTDKKTLRNFGLLFFVVLGAMAGLSYWKGSSHWPWFIGGSGLFLILGLFFPSLLKSFYKVWMVFAFLLGWVMTRVILTLTFFLVFTPVGFMLRVLGKDLLNQRIGKNASTYWRRREPIWDKSRYLKQY
ncbi:MAG: hypothetical protein C4291_00735 [Candidatus Dadabacteria bacterium]